MKPLCLTLLFALLFPSPAVFSEPTPLVLWHSYRGKEKAALEKVCAAYGGSGVKVTLLPVPQDPYPDKITAAIPRGKGPDLFIFGHDRIGDWAESGLLEPLDFWAGEAVRQEYLPECVPPLEYKGSLYGLPISFKCVSLFYNRKVVSKVPERTDTLIAQAKALTDPSKQQFGLVYEMSLLYYHAGWLFGFGGGIFGHNGKVVIDTPEARSALQFAGDLLLKYAITPKEAYNAVVTRLFNEGKAAFAITGPWFLAEISENIDFGIGLLPIIEATGNRAAPFLTSEAVMISAKSGHKEGAWKLARYLTTGEASRAMALEGRQLPADRATLEAPEVAKLAFVKAFSEQLKYTVPTPNLPEMRMVWTPYDRAIGKVMNGSSTPAEALAECQSSIERDVARYRR